MPKVMQELDRLPIGEKLDVLNYLLGSISISDRAEFPAWHEQELRATEGRVSAGLERPIPWGDAKAILRGVN